MAQPPLLCEEGNALHRYVTVIMKSSTKTFGELLPNPSCAPGHFVGHFTAKRASEDILRTGGSSTNDKLLCINL